MVRKSLGDNLARCTVCLLLGLVVFFTILSLEPDHHNPPCGGSNIVVALRGPQGAYANAPGTGGCQPLAVADVLGGTILLIPCVLVFFAALKQRRRRPAIEAPGSIPPRVDWRSHDSQDKSSRDQLDDLGEVVDAADRRKR